LRKNIKKIKEHGFRKIFIVRIEMSEDILKALSEVNGAKNSYSTLMKASKSYA